VAVDVGAGLQAHVGGIKRCGSPWACPVCGPYVRSRRADHINEGVSWWLSQGGGAEFVTQTLRHHLTDSLVSRLDVVSQSQRLVLSGEPWKRRARRLGFVGGIKAVEVTHSERNGWHAHSHSLWLFERPLTDAQRADLESWGFGRWRAVASRRGLGEVTREHGFDMRRVWGADDLGDYLTKVEGGWSAGNEVARGDLKGHGPFELLRELIETGERKWARRWREYESATFGRKAVNWSPGLRGRLLGNEEEPSDVALAAAEGADLTLLRALIPKTVWDGWVRGGVSGDRLGVVEQVAGVLLAMSEYSGAVVQPLDVPRSDSGGERSHREPPALVVG
jgi:hypothetical protein